MNLNDAATLAKKIVDNVKQHIVGKDHLLENIMITLIARGHILFEDYPGLAKTMIANLFSQSFQGTFRRVQFTPDLLPGDIIGTNVYNLKTQEFEFHKGPVFSNILLADEINRAPPKTQAALLESMQEYQVSVEGVTYPLPQPYLVIATQNPLEMEGTFALPEAELDRFMVRFSVGYPSFEDEIEILQRRIERKTTTMKVDPVCTTEDLVKMQNLVENIYVSPDILKYITEIVQETRKHPKIIVGASPRASLALLALGRASALYNGRDYVIADDVKRFATAVLAHRITIRTGEWLTGQQAQKIIEEIIHRIPAPRKDIKV